MKRKVNYGDRFCIEKRPILVGVSGGTASGKTSMCEIIQEQFPDQCSVVCMDVFYKDLEGDDLQKANT